MDIKRTMTNLTCEELCELMCGFSEEDMDEEDMDEEDQHRKG